MPETAPASPHEPVGLIVPPQEGQVPADAHLIYSGLAFESVGLGLRRMDARGYNAAGSRIVQQARQLDDRGVRAIGVMGTSLTFFHGRQGNLGIERAVREATGLPCVTMSSGLVMGLTAVGSTSPVLASAYSPTVHAQLDGYLREEGFDPRRGANLDIVELEHLDRVEPADVVALGLRAWAAAERSGDALVISCGGFRTRAAVLMLEETLGVPVVSSAIAGLWAVVGAADYDARVPGLGRLLQGAPSDRRPERAVVRGDDGDRPYGEHRKAGAHHTRT